MPPSGAPYRRSRRAFRVAVGARRTTDAIGAHPAVPATLRRRLSVEDAAPAKESAAPGKRQARLEQRAVQEQRDDRADDRADEPRRLHRALVDVLAEQDVAEEPANERAHDAERHRPEEAESGMTGDKQARGEAGDDADDHE